MAEAKIAIVGSGLVGRGWAITFARAGFPVAMWDAAEGAAERAREPIATALADLAAHDLLGGTDPALVQARITVAGDLDAALDGAVHVQESAPEKVEVKREVFARLDAAAASNTVLASSTSGIVASAFTEDLAGRARCLVAHPLNPPFLIPAVEIVPSPWTDPAIVERTRDLMRAIGQSPIVMTRELEGFIVNRLQAALVEEAFRLVAGGYASGEDVDRAVRDGLGLRWSFMGPFETGDLNSQTGLRGYADLLEQLCHRIVGAASAPVDWHRVLDDGLEAERRAVLPIERLGERQAWRDRRLMALAVHRAEQRRGESGES